MFISPFRTFAWRLGRKLYCWARGDLTNDPETNGEYWLLGEVVKASSAPLVLFDVGSNKGEWTLRALSSAQRTGKQAAIGAFEPCAATRSILEARVAGNANVEVYAAALSSADGEAEFFSSGAGAGTNSLNAVSGTVAERVQLVAFDSFARAHGIQHVSMLKIDTEGYDFDVLQGARQMLIDGAIDVLQFEYNWRWLLNKASLLDVFTLIQDLPYRFGKLNGDSIEFHEKWHFELDRFFENNYVLVLKGSKLERLGKAVRFDSSNCVKAASGIDWR